MKKPPKVSVVIPAYNEATYIDRLLNALVKQSYKDLEVIVSDAESKDGTKEVVESFKSKLDIKFIESPPLGPAHGRNIGAKKANGVWLLFFDADVDIYDQDFIGKLLSGTQKHGWSTSSAQLRVQRGSLLGKIGHSQPYMNLMARLTHGFNFEENKTVYEFGKHQKRN
jgi:glycosyltransferase involved in cell wall biosynthesis